MAFPEFHIPAEQSFHRNNFSTGYQHCINKIKNNIGNAGRRTNISFLKKRIKTLSLYFINN